MQKENLKVSIADRGQQYVYWLEQLKQVTADKLKCEPYEVVINTDAAFPYYQSGFTPTQCFREEWG